MPDRCLQGTARVYTGGRPPRITRDELLVTVRPEWHRSIAAARTSTPPARARMFKMVAV
jgi:hypothetical protein